MVVTLGLVRDAPVYCPDGIRHKDGVNYSEALVRNVGTYVLLLRERHKQKSCKADSTDTLHRDGLTGSSDEASVMDVERSGQLIQLIELINQESGRNLCKRQSHLLFQNTL